MAKIYTYLFPIMVIFASCNQSKSNSTSSGPTNNMEISDAEFQQEFAAIKASKIDSPPSYSTETTTIPRDSSEPVLTTPAIAGCQIPKKLGDLNAGQFFYYKFSKNTSAAAASMGFTGSIGKNELLIIKDFATWKDITCDGRSLRYGIGLRCFIHVKSLKGKLTYTSLPAISANVELNNAEAEYSFSWLGTSIDGKDIIGDRPMQGSLDVQNFANEEVIFANAVREINPRSNPKMIISPALLPTK